MRVYRIWCKFGFRFILGFFLIYLMKAFCHWTFFNKHPAMVYRSQKEINMELETLLQDLIVREDNLGCQIPTLNPFSAAARGFDKNFKTIICDTEEWVECYFSKCYVKKPILNRMKNLTCIYKDIIYINDDTCYLGKANIVQGEGEYSLKMSDYIRVACIGAEINSDGQRWIHWQGHKAGFRPLPLVASRNTSFNIFMLIIDSTSRNTFIRRLPISYKVLKEDLGAVVMNGYNILGESTAGALWPILTGHNEFELPDCRKLPGNNNRINPKPFLFKFLNKYGYRTAFFEDMPWFHTFNYRFSGFENMPVNHYMRLLFQDIGWNNQKKLTDRQRYCFGSDLLFKFMIKYSAELFKMSVKKFCLMLSGTFSHDDINAITMVDEDLAHFLRKFKRDRHLEDTLLLVMSDHGSRISAIRNTYQGRLEEYLPFVSIVLPKKLQHTRPQALYNLAANSKVLTTPFDIHTTILDVIGLKKYRNSYKVPGAKIKRGLSFLNPIPESRSCGEAGIMPHFCTCVRWQSVSASDIVYTKAAWKLAAFINEIIAHNHQCVKRELLSIAGVYRLGPMIDLLEFTTKTNVTDKNTFGGGDRNLQQRLKASREYYQVKIVMSPREAIFEGAMHYNVKKDSFRISDRDVSRIDRYGNEPWCVSHTQPLLNKYCYCVDV